MRERKKRERETFAYDFMKYKGHTANQRGPKCKSDKHTASRSTHFHEQTVKSLPDQYLHDRVILLICIIAKSYKEIRTSTRAEGVKPMKKIAVNCERRHCCYDAYGNKQKTVGR